MSLFDFFKRNKKSETLDLSSAELGKVMRRLDSVSVCSGNDKTVFSKEQLDESKVKTLLDEVLAGKWNKLVMDLAFQDDGVFVKKLKKTVYKNWLNTVVVHNAENGMALVYINREKNRCYELIGDYHIYSCVDMKEIKEISLGTARVPEYLVHKDGKEITKGLKLILTDIDSAVDRILDSEGWSEAMPAGTNSFNKLCVQFGAVEE
ncbi:MAG: hypothetical protein IJ379_05595 [Lachnospiraceae bacterium]|nr:hypothetical protein [Lachnospiraceae bacterium]